MKKFLYIILLASLSFACDKTENDETLRAFFFDGRNYLLDDGSAENSWRFTSNYGGSYGNKFVVNETGVIKRVQIYVVGGGNQNGRKVQIDIYNADRELVDSSSQFEMQQYWQYVELPDVPFSDTFYVMVRWNKEQGNTHFLGCDYNGPNSKAELNYSIVGGKFNNIPELNPGKEDAKWVFMIRVNANVKNNSEVKNKSVYYGSEILDGYDVTEK